MIPAPVHVNSPGATDAEAVGRSRSPRERQAPMPDSVPRAPRKRPHHGTTAQQIAALDQLATETAERLRSIELALMCRRILPDPAAGPQPEPCPPSPQMARRHGLYLAWSR